MTQDEIIRMAFDAGLMHPAQQRNELREKAVERFAALVAAHEREKQAEQEPIENNDWKKASYIRETLNAEQAAEPVAYRVWDRMGGIIYRRTKPIESEYVEWDALYAAPVRTKDLTDAHILVLWQETATPDAHRIERFARAVIAADREKNK